VCAGHIGLSVYGDRQFSEAVVARPARPDGVRRPDSIYSFGLLSDGGLIEGPLVYQTGDRATQDQIACPSHQHRHNERERRIGPGQPRTCEGEAGEHTESNEDIGASMKRVGE
jgi:hypothetical protein